MERTSPRHGLEPASRNWVVVRITNKGLNELGTGGIVAPVMFWSPDDANWIPGA